MKHGIDLVGAMLFFAIFVLFIAQIAMRYIFNAPLSWPDEVISILWTWVVMWGGSLMVRPDRQIAFDLFHNALPRSAARWSLVTALTVTGILLLAALPVVVDYVLFMHRQRTPALLIPLSYVYAPAIPFMLVTALALLEWAWRVARGTNTDSPSL
jgi:TRAP-type C4-dicarboxylate transport system permease small subunit